jgi:Fe-Mn family superoxide dismutase
MRIATGEETEDYRGDGEKDVAAKALGRKGGAARAAEAELRGLPVNHEAQELGFAEPFGVQRLPSTSPRSCPMSFSLPDLPYAYDALGPYMSRETLEYHHDKHHLAYVNNGNAALKGTEWEGKSLEEIVKGSFGKNAAVFNNAGQHFNHIHFWRWMKPNGGGKIPGEVERALKDSFGSVDKAKEDLIQAGVTQFGSGWCWLTLKGGKVEATKTPNGENPLVHGGKPILGIDVWEHSYYIDYRNRRPDYLKAVVDHLVNWEYVAELFGQK